ncbi:ATPase [Pseudomonas sp. NPDC096925]|uniref:ATPase n=1 Tax=Pseudomonas sp. NPDC096925 TaxID=3364484 RepID=UPI00383A79EB
MKTGMIAALLALLAALGGCASPAATDTQPYGHFYSATAISSVALAPGQRVAVLLGRDTTATLEYLDSHRTQAAAKAQGKRVPVATLSSESQAYDWLARSLAQQFADVTFYDDLDTLLGEHPDVIVLLDTESRLASADIESRVVARFFDDQLTYIGRAEGRASKRLGDVARVVEDERAVQADALRDFDDSLQALLKRRV